MFFVFIDFQRKSPPPTVIAGARCCAHRQASARTREWMARGRRARRPDPRLPANLPPENWRGRATAVASEWMTQDWRSGRLRL